MNPQQGSRYKWLRYLQGATFRFQKYTAATEEWKHDHCDGCSAKFAEYEEPNVLHEGYVAAVPYEEGSEPEFITECREQGLRCVTQPAVHGHKLYWVCARCFQESGEALGFRLQS